MGRKEKRGKEEESVVGELTETASASFPVAAAMMEETLVHAGSFSAEVKIAKREERKAES